jgi:hypothetical protein
MRDGLPPAQHLMVGHWKVHVGRWQRLVQLAGDPR